jgi:RNA polymerase sigma factor (TIGR02999 family)
MYGELRRLARRYLQRERSDHTLLSAALVNEAYLRLASHEPLQLNDRSHFFRVAAKVMRRILVDHARGRNAIKRGAGALMLELDETVAWSRGRTLDVAALDDALEELGKFDPQQSQVVELRFFGGHSIEETAEMLDVSPATVKRDWETARLWLQRELRKSSPREPRKRQVDNGAAKIRKQE